MIDQIDNNLFDFDDDIVDTHIKNSLKLIKENKEDKKIKIPRTISCKNISILEDTDTKIEIPRKTPYKKMNVEENMLEFNDKIIIQYNSNLKKEDNKTIINRKIVDAKLTLHFLQIIASPAHNSLSIILCRFMLLIYMYSK